MHDTKVMSWACALVLVGCGGKREVNDGPVTDGAMAPRAPDPGHGAEHGHGAEQEAEHGHGAEHVHEAPHGGVMVAAGDHHLEAVTSKMGLVLYLYDANEKELPVSGVAGKVVVTPADGSAPLTAKVTPMGNHLMTDLHVSGAWSAVATLDIRGKNVAARFQSAAVAGHTHGGPPAMELSDVVKTTVAVDGTLAAGQPTTLTLAYTADGKPVADFAVTHERRLHVFIVSADLSFYDHVHPEPVEPASDGRWSLRYSWPAPGKYRIYSDFTSETLGALVTVADLEVPGEAPPAQPLTVDSARTKDFGQLTVVFTPSPTPLKARTVTTLTYEISVGGAKVTDLEPYLGAMGHLFILGEDRVTMAHSHPEGTGRGPTVSFMALFPKPGKYKLWAQFQRGGEIVTSDWVVNVE